MQNKRGQITLFVIIAVVIIAAVVAIFLARNIIFPGPEQQQFSEIYEYFGDCIKQKTLQGLNIAGSQGGYIELPDFQPGSEYAPFSSQLDFLGTPVPYWYYVSSNNIIKEQVPSLSSIEWQMEEFLEREISKCDFSKFREQGIEIVAEVPDIDVKIKEKSVDVAANVRLNVAKDSARETKSSFPVKINSKFGKFYNTAKQIYEKEKLDMFLEKYGVDVMYNYAPVTGVEISCSPKIWNPKEVADNIRKGLSANTQMLRIGENKGENYFMIEGSADENVNFMYIDDWSTKIEIWPVENNVMIAEPVGLQSGMGILGFCYVPYHFVYDIYYPVLIQIYDNNEIFQFPVSVVIDKSVPRNSLAGSSSGESARELCSYKNTEGSVYTYDSDNNPVEAEIDFVCLNQKCSIGRTRMSGQDSVLKANFPQCINGIVVANAEGYREKEIIVSTNSPQNINVLMNKIYTLDFEIISGGRVLSGDEMAVIHFDGLEDKFSLVAPEQKKVSLIEDDYMISVQIFGAGSLTIPESSSRQCVKASASGILGIFGKTEEQCFDITMPAQKIENVLIAGGKLEYYFTEDELRAGKKIRIDVPAVARPINLEQLQKNYENIEINKLGVEVIR